MEEELTIELARKLMGLKGEARGVHFTLDRKYVEEKAGGKKAVRRVEEELERVGCPLRYDEIESLEFYPLGWRAISLLAIKQALGFSEEDFRRLGFYSAKASLVVKLYLKFFYSLPKMVKKGSQIWREYFTKGELTVPEYNPDKKFARIRIDGFDMCPSFCRDLEGYFTAIGKMVVKTEESRCKETKCTFKGNEYHEFLLEWT